MGLFDFIDEKAAEMIADSIEDSTTKDENQKQGSDETASLDTTAALNGFGSMFGAFVNVVNEVEGNDKDAQSSLDTPQQTDKQIEMEKSEPLKVDSVVSFKSSHEQKVSDIADKYGKSKEYFSGMTDEELAEYDQAMTGDRPLLWN